MIIGFSFSPGGLLLPYHAGVLAALQSNGFVTGNTPLAGSSAGAIAVAAHACGIPPKEVLEATIELSDRCKIDGGARGRLLPQVKTSMSNVIGDDEFQNFCQREAPCGICYKEIFPRFQSHLQTNFESKDDLIQAVCNSCMFPFFSTNFPCAIDSSTTKFPRLVMDGYFAVPRNRFGCPDLDDMMSTLSSPNETNNNEELHDDTGDVDSLVVDRTITVSVFPHSSVGLSASEQQDQISPRSTDPSNLARLVKIATQATSRQELTYSYELGYSCGEDWCRKEFEK